MFMDLYEAIAKRRSIRKFREEPVPEEALKRILEAGRWAPSAGNTQPWHFIVVTKVDIKQRIVKIFTEFSRKTWAEFSSERARYLAARGGSWDKSSMAKVPVLVAVCYGLVEGVRAELVLASVWAAVENMLLAATAEGLGSCIYTFYNIEEENMIKKLLDVSENYRIAAIIQLGYAAAEPPAPSRKALEEIVSYQHF